jgi:fermentation-respiration switch protein FrsA (DUF1100 family)
LSNDQSLLSIIMLCVILLIAFSGFIFCLLLFYAHRAFHRIFNRPYPRPLFDRSPMDIKQDTTYGRGLNWFYSNRMDFEDLKMTSYDGLELSAYFRRPKNNASRRLVILLHGWKESPSIMAAFAQMYIESMDCYILIVHMRAHGMSEGKYIGFGLSDSQDLLMWTALMEARLKGPLSIFYHGWSMGASTALMAAGSRALPTSVKGVVADCPFDSFDNEIRHIIRKRYHIAPRFFIKMISYFSKRHVGYSLHQISPIARAKFITVPVLLIHGTADAFIPPRMSEAIYSKLLLNKKIFIVQNADHVMSYEVAPSGYSSQVEQILIASGMK